MCVQGELTCRNETKTVVVESPVESCELEPVRQCHHVTKQVTSYTIYNTHSIHIHTLCTIHTSYTLW